MNEREGFELSIKDNPKDYGTRLAFSDWLLDHDEPELSDWHRSQTPHRITQSEEWLVEFSELVDMTVEEATEALMNFHKGGKYHTLPFNTPDEIFSQKEEMWKHFAVITDSPEAVGYDLVPFTCSC